MRMSSDYEQGMRPNADFPNGMRLNADLRTMGCALKGQGCT